MEAYANALSYAIPTFVILIIYEGVAARLMGKDINRSDDIISSLSSGMTNTLKSLLGISIIIVSYDWMEKAFGLFEIKSELWLYIIAFILLDFAYYWTHRFNHVINIFWNRHIVHHSSEEFNLSCALRQEISAIVGIYFLLYIPMAMMGVPTEIVAVAAPLHLFAQFWYHTRLIDKLGILEYIIVTPSHHRVHHAINDIYIDKNYSAIFIVWDKMFGTFQEELDDVEPIYGTLKPAHTWNPIIINYQHMWQLIQDAWRAKNIEDKFKIWFMPTGWRPEDVKEKHPLPNIAVHERKKYQPKISQALRTWSWIQFLIANGLLYHMVTQFDVLSFQQIAWYSAFIFSSIFGFTSLMDFHIVGVVFEIIKTIIGLIIMITYGSWFGLESFIPLATILMTSYLFLVTPTAIYFYYIEGESKPFQLDYSH